MKKNIKHIRASLIVHLVKNPPTMQEIPVGFLGREDLLERVQATHSSNSWAFLGAQLVKNLLAMWETWVGKIPWRRESLQKKKYSVISEKKTLKNRNYYRQRKLFKINEGLLNKICLIILAGGSRQYVAIEAGTLTILPGRKKQFSKQP